MSTEFYWVAVVLVTIVSVARITRLLTFDKFPPVKHFRDKYENKTDGTDWFWLALCGYCMAPWVSIPVIGLGFAADVYGPSYPDTTAALVWWIVTGWWAVSYLAAIVMANDGDKTVA